MSINFSNLSCIENFSITLKLTEALSDLNSTNYLILGNLNSRILGAVSIPFAALTDAVIHVSLSCGKMITGLVASPYNIVALRFFPKKSMPRDLEFSSAFIHLVRVVECIFTAAILPLACLINPSRTYGFMYHRHHLENRLVHVQKEALKGEINKLKTKIEEGQNDLMTQVSLYQKQTTTSANLEDKLAKLMEELQQKEKDLEKVSQEKSALQIEVDTGSIHQKIQHLTKNNSLIQSQLNEKEKERLEGSQEVKRLSLELKEKSSALENSHTLLDQSKCHLQAKDIKNYFSAKEIEKLTAALAQKEAIFHQQKSTMQETEELKTKNLEETIQQLKFELIKKSQTIDLSDKISQKIQENLLIARQEIQHLNEAQLFTQNQLENKEKERKEALQALENLNLTINKQKIEWNQKEQDPEQIAKKTNKNLEHYSQLENEQKELIQKLAGQIEEKEKLLIDKENLIKIYEEKNKHYQLTIIQKEEEISTLEENAKKTKGEYERRYKEYSEGFKIACQKDVEQYSKQLEKQCIRRIKINDKEAMLKIGNKDQEIKTLKQTNEDQADSLVETERRLKQTQARVACLNEDLDKQIEEAGEKDAKKKQEIKELREELLEVNKTVLERDRLIRSLQDKPIKKDAFLGTQLTAPLSRKNKRKSLRSESNSVDSSGSDNS